MLDDLPTVTRAALLSQSPRRRERIIPTPSATPTITPTASPQRKCDAAPPRERAAWMRDRSTPAAIQVPAATAPSFSHNRGHQFTVGNVSNGLIYLRPVARPAHELHRTYGVGPTTPPSSAEELAEKGRDKDGTGQIYDASLQSSPPRTPTRNPAIDRYKDAGLFLKSSPPIPQRRHQRSRSYTTVDSHRNVAQEPLKGDVQIRIDQFDGLSPGRGDLRPRTAGNAEHDQSLDVQIPHYNLGSPRFSPGGTPFMYGGSSLQLPSTAGEVGSSAASQVADVRWLFPGAQQSNSLPPVGFNREITASIISTIAPSGIFPSATFSSVPRVLAPSALERSPSPSVTGVPSAAFSSIPLVPSPPVPPTTGPLRVDPFVFDEISAVPGLEDPRVVRYDSQSRDIIAATPIRIIVQITSAVFVDYHLLSDFFLTFRLFMNAHELASLLLSRLKWAIERQDDSGKVIRVRTFVAIRHWLLNYFADDFVPSLEFRKEFAVAMNELTRSVAANGKAADLKILGELKKCWRSTCTLYWDVEEKAEAQPEDDILSGGPPGTREATIARSSSSVLRLPQISPPSRLDSPQGDQGSGTESFIREVIHNSRFNKLDRQNTNSTEGSASGGKLGLGSAAQSAQTLPSDPRRRPSEPDLSKSPIKKFRSGPHKRSGSFSDALRDNRYPLPLPSTITRSAQTVMAMPYVGSIVRGNMFPPTPAYVEVIAPSTPINGLSNIRFGAGGDSTVSSIVVKQHGTQPKHTGPGVRRIFGSVRKALGKHVHHSASSSIASNKKTSSIKSGLQIPTFSLPGNVAIFEATAGNATGTGMGVLGEGRVERVDLLGACAIEAFRRAMLEENSVTGSEPYGGSTGVVSGEGLRPRTTSQVVGEPTEGDAAIDGKTDVIVEHGSLDGDATSQAPFEESDEKDGLDGKDFLESPSPSSMASDPEGGEYLGGETSFLADKSEQTVSSRNSVLLDIPPIPPIRGSPSTRSQKSEQPVRQGSVRRTRSFSFLERPSRITRQFQYLNDHLSLTSPPTTEPRSGSIPTSSLQRGSSVRSQYSSVMDNVSEFSELSKVSLDAPLPKALLRRRPGGNLRAAVTVGELERPMSTGSIGTTNCSASVRSFDLSMSVRSLRRAISPTDRRSNLAPSSRLGAGIISLGAMGKGGLMQPAPPVPELPRQLLSTTPEEARRSEDCEPRDSKASFEAGVQMLRDLPDDETDDGMDVALAKLEGTYQRKRSEAGSPFEFRKSLRKLSNRESSMLSPSEPSKGASGFDGADDDEHRERLKRRHKQVVDHIPLETPPLLEEGSSVGNSVPRSIDSESFIERGLSVGSPQLRRTALTGSSDALADPRPLSVFPAPLSTRPTKPSVNVNLELVDQQLEQHMGETRSERRSSYAASDISSEISFEMLQSGSKRSSSRAPGSGAVISELGITSHPLRHPPSPPLTLKQAPSLSPGPSKLALDDPPRTPTKLPTPEYRTDFSPLSQRTATRTITEAAEMSTPRPNRESEVLQPTAVHLPFILAYDSELIAKQLTLIEKDALLEVDWKELVELSWRQTDESIKDWVALLNARDIRGVEVVIARFNLMCKWARSEIVMTRSANERARTIVKFIHIAAHARALNNYATMYQITIALLTADIARLRKTWELVSPAEKATFRELEALVQPVRNFHNLRTEMDKITGETGCIPFVGLFTHDLILNAQRLPFIPVEGHPELPPLINFERHRTTAQIIKRLLRLSEASHKYAFEAVDGVCERCLWISALSDEDIRALSNEIE